MEYLHHLLRSNNVGMPTMKCKRYWIGCLTTTATHCSWLFELSNVLEFLTPVQALQNELLPYTEPFPTVDSLEAAATTTSWAPYLWLFC